MSRKTVSFLTVLVLCTSIGVWLVPTATSQESTNVTYIIIASDKAKNIISSNDLFRYANGYEVFLEFPVLLFLSIFLVATIIAVIVNQRRLKKGNYKF